jgi:hypothetical protein
MEDGREKTGGREYNSDRDEIYSKAVRAGKRTYFFDVKSTRKSEHYLTITESIKKFNREGRYFYEKHKIFLYNEDFEKFMEGLNKTMNYIKSPNIVQKHEDDGEIHEVTNVEENCELVADNYVNVDFDDLDTKND